MNSPSLTLLEKKSVASSFSPETVHILALTGVAFAVVVPMILWGMPSALDLSNHFRFALPFYDALRSGHLYPGWLAESNHGFGDASFRFYPPALYYLLSAFRAVSGNWYIASVATFGSLSMLGVAGIYLWAREFTSSVNAMWAGIFYAAAPYHVNQLYQALLLAEFAGAAILPFAFLFAERVCRRRRARDIAGLATAYGLLILTHLPLAVIGSIALAFYCLLRIDKKKFAATIAALLVAVVLGLAASACYWVTMISELNWIRADNVNPDPGLGYRDNFVLSTLSPEHLNVWWMNILLASMLAMFWPALILITRRARVHFPKVRENASVAGPLAALLLLLLLSLFMATPLSRPIWNLIHPLQETQFPWRWFVITSLCGPFLLALAVPFWSRLVNTPKRPLVIFACGTIAISFAFSMGQIIREARWLTPVQFEQLLTSIPGTMGVYQWMPVWAHARPEMNVAAEAGDRDVKVESWSPEKRVFRVGAGAATEARVRTFFYPHWVATAAGRVLETHPDYEGALMISLPPQAADVTLEFREPSRTRYAAVLTAIGWACVAGLFLGSKQRSKLKSISRFALIADEDVRAPSEKTH
jgi:hypothetical protein